MPFNWPLPFRLLVSDLRFHGVRGDRFQHRLHLTDLLVAELWFLFQRAQHDFIEAHINLDFSGGRLDAFAGEFAGEDFVKNDAE